MFSHGKFFSSTLVTADSGSFDDRDCMVLYGTIRFFVAIAVINALGEPDKRYQLFAGKIMSSHYVAAKASQELHASFL